MLNCNFHILQLLKAIVSNSGSGINHRGQYYDCLENSEMKYVLVEYGTNGIDTTLFTGLCLPKQCSDRLINRSLNYALHQLQSPLSVFSINSKTDQYEF